MTTALKYAIRALQKKPGFTVVAVLMLGLGIGANTALFSIVDTVVLRPLPYEEPDSLVMLWGFDTRSGEGRWSHSFPDYADFRDQNRSFDELAAWTSSEASVIAEGVDPLRVTVTPVSHNLFPVLGLEPAVGRAFRPDEDREGAERLAILGHAFWRQRFGSSPGVLGRTLLIDGETYTVIGVTSPDFRGGPVDGRILPPTDTDVWTALRGWVAHRGVHNLILIARMRSGITFTQANEDVGTIAARTEELYPETNLDRGTWVEPAHEALVGNIRPILLLLFGAVGFVLLIACANVANLLLSRAATRDKEVAICAALGAKRVQIIGQLLVESLLLSLAGGLLGLLIAFWGANLFVTLNPDSIPRLNEVAISWRGLGYMLAVALGTGIAFGIVPALRATRADLASSLKDGGRRSASGASRSRFRQLLVVGEVALAVLLAVAASLLLHSLWLVSRVDPGFDAEDVLAVDLQIPVGFLSEEWPRSVGFFEEVIRRVEGVPGVESAVAAYHHPVDPGWETGFAIAGRPEPAPGEEPEANLRPVTPGYFEAMGIRLVRGRTFRATDDADGPGVAIVNESFVRRFFADEDPIGKRLLRQHWWGARGSEYEIVGVVEDVRFGGPDYSAPARQAFSTWAMYFPHAQQPFNFMTLLVRTNIAPLGLADSVRREIWSVDPSIPAENMTTLERLLGESVSPRWFNTLLLGSFAGAALLLAAVGIYGVVSFAVAQRRREIGLRMALGARRADVLRLVLTWGMGLTVAGLALGIAGSLVASRLMTSFLFGVTSTDPLTLAAVALFLTAVSMLACYLPARRAAHVDPLISLR